MKSLPGPLGALHHVHKPRLLSGARAQGGLECHTHHPAHSKDWNQRVGTKITKSGYRRLKIRTEYPKLNRSYIFYWIHFSLTKPNYDPFPPVPLSEIHTDTNAGTASAPTFLNFGACFMPNARLETVLDRLYDTRVPFHSRSHLLV